MSAVATAWAKAVIKNNPFLEPSDKRLLKALARFHSADKGYAAPSYRDLASETEDSRRTTLRATERLVSFGLADKEAQRKGQRQAPNRYFLNMGVLRVPPRHSQDASSGCHDQTSEVVTPRHPEKFPQGATMTPTTCARARSKDEAPLFGSLRVVGGRHG